MDAAIGEPYGDRGDEGIVSAVETDASSSEIVLGVLHDVSNSITSLGGAARTLVTAQNRIDPPLRGELGALVLRQVTYLSWLVDAMREACDGPVEASPGRVIDTAYLVRTASTIAGTAVRIDGSAAIVGDFERIRLGLEAVLDAIGHGDAVVSLDENGRIMIVRAGPMDLSFGGVRWRFALARRLLESQQIDFTVEGDSETTRATVTFPRANIRLP